MNHEALVHGRAQADARHGTHLERRLLALVLFVGVQLEDDRVGDEQRPLLDLASLVDLGGRGREGKGREGKGGEGRGREGKGEGKGRERGWEEEGGGGGGEEGGGGEKGWEGGGRERRGGWEEGGEGEGFVKRKRENVCLHT